MNAINIKKLSIGILKLVLPVLILLFVQAAANAQSYTTDEKNCFDLVQGKVVWDQGGTNKTWRDEDVRNLCRGNRDPEATINCYTDKVKTSSNYLKIISDCSYLQQQWASQYVKWTFDKAVDVWNIDQQVWFPTANNTSYMPLQWTFKGSEHGGYMGLQQADGAASQNVRFSIWNSTEAKGTNCMKFGGEGVGYTCVLPVKIDPKKYYRYRLWKGERARDGQWWGAWLIEVENGKLTEHLIGNIKAPAAYNIIDPASIKNFVEYWGRHIAPCGQLPASVMAFTPPAVNYKGKGTGAYESYSKYAGSDRAGGNVCQNGKEKQGALLTATPYNFGFTNGVMMFIGGSVATSSLDKNTYPTPPIMPLD